MIQGLKVKPSFLNKKGKIHLHSEDRHYEIVSHDAKNLNRGFKGKKEN